MINPRKTVVVFTITMLFYVICSTFLLVHVVDNIGSLSRALVECQNKKGQNFEETTKNQIRPQNMPCASIECRRNGKKRMNDEIKKDYSKVWETQQHETRSFGKVNSSASTSDFVWTKLSENLTIYSSYYDGRDLRDDHKRFLESVAVFGYEFGPISGTMFCVIILDDMKTIVREAAVRLPISELFANKLDKYRAFMYRCKITAPAKPWKVTLTKSSVKNVPYNLFIPVVYPESPAVQHEFGVCYGSPLYGHKYVQDIIDSIEMNRLLGATWFTIYVYEAQDEAVNIIKYYSQELKILDAVLNWGVNMPKPLFYMGQLVGVNDCLYRNMYRVQFLVMCDLDEIITPVKGINWHDIVAEIDKKDIGQFIFPHVGMHINVSKPQEFHECLKNKSISFKTPRFLKTKTRSVNALPIPFHAKSMAKPPLVKTVKVHGFRAVITGYRKYDVQENVAIMTHFRDTPGAPFKNDKTITDNIMDRYKLELLKAVEKQFCRKREVVVDKVATKMQKKVRL